MNVELCTRSCVNAKLLSLLFFHAQSPFDRSFLECRSVWVLLILRSGLDDSKCTSQFLLREHTCSRDDEVSLSIGSCHPTEFSVFVPVVHHSMECEWQSMLNVSFHQQVFVCVGMHTCLCICIHLDLLNFVHLGTCRCLHEFHLW